VFTDKNGNIIDDNSPDENEGGNSPEIAGVSNTGTMSNNNVPEIVNSNTWEISDMLNSTGVHAQSENTEAHTTHEDKEDLHEVHTTHEDDEDLHDEPTTYGKQIVE